LRAYPQATYFKRRIRGMAKKDYRRDEHKNSPSSFNFAQRVRLEYFYDLMIYD
jgi:hypothetical protein